MATASHPSGANSVNPFVITDDASAIIDFVIDVFDAKDEPAARTLDGDGLILHSELHVGDSLLMIADRKPDWSFTPAFTRVYVADVDDAVARAERHGARIVTKPTEFFGDVLARVQDASGNLWWICQHDPKAAQDWSNDDGAWGGEETAGSPAEWTDAAAEAGWESYSTPELEYIHSTLAEAMASLRDPRAG